MRRILLGGGVLALGAGLAFGFWGLFRPPQPELLEVRPAPAFSMTDHEAKPIASGDMLGRAWIADFVFTRCTSICPVLTSAFSRLDGELPPGVQLVSFSLDPAHDTPEVLKRYAESSAAGSKRWRFVATGTTAARDALVAGFLLDARDTPEDAANPIVHSSRLALVDAGGVIRGYYDGTDPEAVKKLRRDATALSMTGLYGLPAVNASLNAASLVLLLAAYGFVKAKRYEEHVAFVLGALVCSSFFLGCYLYYHAHAGATRYGGPGRVAYLGMLTSHTVLAALVPILIAVVIVNAIKRKWDIHRKWARFTLPVWLYVSGTGVLIYCVLFRRTA
ncbi:MAG: DUF420 domain-containing protein [Planctomycetes bacterium]|nr:DUF420 domain-containing protein [Planctomycetota bacterium]